LPDRARFEILTPSAYYPHKNLEIIPAVAAELTHQDPTLDFVFHLTLDPASEPWQRIQASAESMGVGQRVQTSGILPLPELAKAYQTASAVFLPTLREASTAVYPESFYFGRPLITSDIDFARELCGDAAIFVPPMIPAVIAESILTMHRDPVRVAHLVEAGKKRLACAYPSSDDKFCAQIDLLQKVRTSGKTVPPI
jgi:glycosyltransferase involved in cell wall biosynthesis